MNPLRKNTNPLPLSNITNTYSSNPTKPKLKTVNPSSKIPNPISLTDTSSFSTPIQSNNDNTTTSTAQKTTTQKTRRGKKRKREHRIILPKNTTSSLENKDQEITSDIVEHHAYDRLNLAMRDYIGRYKKALTSQGPYHSSSKTEEAILQGAKGSKERHGAHRFYAPGTRDTIRNDYKGQIIEKGITPLKKAVLLKKGFDEQSLDELDKKHDDSDFVEKTFTEIWGDQKEIISIFSKTETDEELNSVTLLPREINLIVDKGLDNYLRVIIDNEIRPAVMKGEISPEEALTKTCELIREHFENALLFLEKQLERVNTYKSNLDLFIKEKPGSEDSVKLLLQLEQDIKLIESCKQQGVPRNKLVQNKRFIKRCKTQFASSKVLKNLPKIISDRQIEELTKEIENAKNLYEKVMTYTKWELSGTELPDMKFYTHKYDSDKKQFEKKTEEEMMELSLDLIKTKEPAKKHQKITPKKLNFDQEK